MEYSGCAGLPSVAWSADARLARSDRRIIFRGFARSFLNCQGSFLNRPLAAVSPLTSARNLRLWVLYAVLIAVMQFSDPLGDVAVADAVLFWAGRLAGTAASLLLTGWVVDRLLRGRLETPAWLKPAILTIVIAAVPMALIETVLEVAVPQEPAYDDSLLRDASPTLALVGEYLTVLSIVLPINILLWVLIDLRAAHAGPAQTEDVRPAEPEFLGKTNGIRLDDVIALGAEEHYVRVFATDRSELVYGRLSDAIAQMPQSSGLQVHRSWWVADAGVVGSTRGARRYRLELSNGDVVPVSDRFLGQVRDRGWLGRNRKPVSEGS